MSNGINQDFPDCCSRIGRNIFALHPRYFWIKPCVTPDKDRNLFNNLNDADFEIHPVNKIGLVTAGKSGATDPGIGQNMLPDIRLAKKNKAAVRSHIPISKRGQNTQGVKLFFVHASAKTCKSVL